MLGDAEHPTALAVHHRSRIQIDFHFAHLERSCEAAWGVASARVECMLHSARMAFWLNRIATTCTGPWMLQPGRRFLVGAGTLLSHPRREGVDPQPLRLEPRVQRRLCREPRLCGLLLLQHVRRHGRRCATYTLLSVSRPDVAIMLSSHRLPCKKSQHVGMHESCSREAAH